MRNPNGLVLIKTPFAKQEPRTKLQYQIPNGNLVVGIWFLEFEVIKTASPRLRGDAFAGAGSPP
jgi:hypothetical protein